MADRRATNKYYPPDWDPSKGSLNTFVGQHPLRERARKLDQGILVVRFEMPFNIWCLGCDNHIGMGVRFNAEKKKIGMYHTSPILSFRMKCHLCNAYIEIHTDPKNTEYKIASGARRREETYDPEDIGVVKLADEKDKQKLAEDPFFKLEHEAADLRRAEEAAPVITTLQKHNDKFWKDPYALSQKVRARFRQEKRVREADAADADSIRQKHGFNFNVLPASGEDAAVAGSIEWKNRNVETHEQKRTRVVMSSVFAKRSKSHGKSSKTTSKVQTPADRIRSALNGSVKDPFLNIAMTSTKGTDRVPASVQSRTQSTATSIGAPLVSLSSHRSDLPTAPHDVKKTTPKHDATGSHLVAYDSSDGDDEG